jgi:hypothetical protein
MGQLVGYARISMVERCLDPAINPNVSSGNAMIVLIVVQMQAIDD